MTHSCSIIYYQESVRSDGNDSYRILRLISLMFITNSVIRTVANQKAVYYVMYDSVHKNYVMKDANYITYEITGRFFIEVMQR